MVFQDYELIMTKRVNHERKTIKPFSKRHFNAAGGWNSVYLGVLFGAIGAQRGTISACEVVPSSQILSRSGTLRYISRAGLWVIAPAIVGYSIGGVLFGDV